MTRIILAFLLFALSAAVRADAQLLRPAYAPPKVVFDIYLDDPAKLGSALYWLRGLSLSMNEPPYEFVPDTVKLVIHGTELVTLAKKNEEKYQETVDRLRYYADLGVEVRVCELAMHDYGYRLEDMQDFVKAVPSAMADLIHWQNQGYALLIPQVMDKRYSIEEIR